MSDNAIQNAKAWLENIQEMVAAYDKANDSLDGAGLDEAWDAINSAPLSVLVRSGWVRSGDALKAAEYEILLSTGGPALRIIGDLDDGGEPCSWRLQLQDWGTPWTDYAPLSEDEDKALRDFVTILGPFTY